jgi:hypothetical protein
MLECYAESVIFNPFWRRRLDHSQRPRRSPPPDVADLSARVEAVERLTRLFRMERMVYLAITCISLLMLLSSAAILILNKKAGPAELTGLFGSSGLITYSAGRLLVMWNQALQLLGLPKESPAK